MTDENTSSSDWRPDAPEIKKGWGRVSIIWVVPLVALIIGGWLLWRDIMSKGPEISVTFQGAEGISAGKTAVRYRDVDVGQVIEVKLAEDLEHVRLAIRMDADFSDYLTDKTRFWVVRPRVTARGITGLDTIVRSEEHTSELQSHHDLVCRLLLEKKKQTKRKTKNER